MDVHMDWPKFIGPLQSVGPVISVRCPWSHTPARNLQNHCMLTGKECKA